MAAVTIIRPDNYVVSDTPEGVKEARLVDCSSLPAEVSVVQWFGDHGWIEYANDISKFGQPDFVFRVNEPITDFEQYQPYLAAWALTKAAPDIKEGQERPTPYPVQLPAATKKPPPPAQGAAPTRRR